MCDRHKLQCRNLILGLAFWVLSIPTHAFAVDPVDRHVALAAAHTQEVEGFANRIQKLAADNSAESILQLIIRIDNDSGLSVVARERLLYEAALAMAHVTPTPASEAFIEKLGNRKPETYVWLNEDPHHRHAGVPLFDIGAAARVTLRFWGQERAKHTALLLLAAGDSRLVDKYVVANEVDRAGITNACATAPTAQLAVYSATVISRLQVGDPITPLAAMLASRLQDMPLYIALAKHGTAATIMRLLPTLNQTLSPSDAFAVLVTASHRDELVSAALLQMGRYADVLPAAQATLFEWLSDFTHGGSAAAALARLNDAGIIRLLGDMLESETNDTTLRRVLLALRLNGSDAASSHLHRLESNPAASQKLKQEIAAW